MCGRHIVSILILAVCRVTSSSAGDEKHAFQTEPPAVPDWWQTAVFYQIYPRSFMDSNGDGFGDLKGIISKLHYLKDTGITATWISPIFQSPGVDQGYDISDYRKIDKLFGTMEDLKELLAEAKRLGIRIILDFVPNHTSDEHEWFKLSENRTAGYEDYYVWVDGIEGVPPNNWISVFKGSAWKWSKIRQQYYLHQFHYKQPDLNFNNPKVMEELKDILTFYLDLGVDGVRVDAVPYLKEDPLLKDEPMAPGKTYDSEDWDSLDHIYTKDIDSTYGIIYEFRDHVDAYTKSHNTETKILMTEAFSPIDKTMLYYGSRDGSRLGAHFTFNFNLLSHITSTNFTLNDLVESIGLWLDQMPKRFTSNWVLGNHDGHRIANRVGKGRIDGFNMLTSFLPGVMVTYYGEEIGMVDVVVPCERGWDPMAIKNCTLYPLISRDFGRTPFQWDSSKNAGFSNGNYTWLPVAKDYQMNNLEAQNVKEKRSNYNIYKELMKFRDAFKNTSETDVISIIKVTTDVLKVSRQRDEGEYVYLFNIGTEMVIFNINHQSVLYNVLVASENSIHRKGDQVSEVSLDQSDCLILKNIS